MRYGALLLGFALITLYANEVNEITQDYNLVQSAAVETKISITTCDLNEQDRQQRYI